MITAEMLDVLERHYTPADSQKCIVCKAPLQFSRSEPGGSRYNCSSEDASPVWSKLPYSKRCEHYMRSSWIDRGQSDLTVVELVRAYRTLLMSGAELYSEDEAAACVAQGIHSELTSLRKEIEDTADGDLQDDWDESPAEWARALTAERVRVLDLIGERIKIYAPEETPSSPEPGDGGASILP